MVDVTPMMPGDRQVIESYGDGRFRVTGVAYQGSIIVFPNRVVDWPLGDIGELAPEQLSDVMVAEPPVEVLLIGCGERAKPVPPQVKKALREAGVGAEPMDTSAACRTYNVLVAEDRRVAAALIAV
jgi:uncharacterized protein